ncbi:MAG: M24 family metallopeptidase [Marinifilaceae bacterium]
MNPIIPIEEIDLHIEQIRKNMADASGMLITCSINLYYCSGRAFNGFLYIPAQGEVLAFLRRPMDNLPFKSITIRKVEDIPGLIDVPEIIYLECDELSFSEVTRISKAFSSARIENATGAIRRARTIKTPWELDQLRYSARLHERTYSEVTVCYEAGMTDIEFQHRIEYVMRRNGSIGVFNAFGNNMDIFMGSLLVGDNAETPSPFDFALGGAGTHPLIPVGASGAVMKDGTSVMVDMSGNYCAYMTDMTRVFSVGKLSEQAYRAHQVSIDMQNEMLSYAKPGTPCAEIYNKALAHVRKEGLEHCFMGTIQQAKFVGHGVGLQINELPVLTPRSKELLEEHQVFAFEPKFVIAGIGAVGVENTFIVGQNGVEKLTLFPEEIIDLKA